MLFSKKIYISVILFITIFFNTSFAEVVKDVKVKGNERITIETIIVFGDISIGKNYESTDINSLIKKLYNTTFFSNISVDLTNNVLNIIVEENPIINSISFKGEKAKLKSI